MNRRNHPHKLTVNTSYRADPDTWISVIQVALALGWSRNTTLEHAAQVLTGLADPDPRTPLGGRLEALHDRVHRAESLITAATPEIDALIRRAEQAEAEAEHLRDVLALVDAAVRA